MKIIIITILTIFTCISVGAKDLNSNYQFTRTDRLPESHLLTSLSGSSFYDDAIPGLDPSWDDGLKIDMKTRTLISAGLFIPTIASGYLMRGSNGNPNDGFLAVHKLTSVSNMHVMNPLSIGIIVLASISVSGLIISGGAMSLDKCHELMLTIHRLSTLAFLFTMLGLFFMLFQKIK